MPYDPTDIPDAASLAALDKQYVWHPFTQMQEWCAGEPLIVAKGDGLMLEDVQGRRYYDGVSSLWVNVHGHRVPEINAAITAQLGLIAHSTMLGAGNVPATLLAERLVGIAPPGLGKVFYSDSGSTAVEIALKMAYQYWAHRGQPGRRRFVKMHDAYHGDTLGSVSVGGMAVFHAAFRDLLFETVTAPYPHPYAYEGGDAEASPEERAEACAAACLAALDEILATEPETLIGVVLEPLVQGAAGIIMMPPGYLRAVADRVRAAGLLLICDEVATGIGRTGAMFACQHEGVTPDLMTTAKGLTGGYLPLAATLATNEIYEAFLGEYAEMKTFFHGHSYTGNQLGAAAALANLELMATRDTVGHVARTAPALAAMLAPLAALPHVGDIRQCGFMVGVELVRRKGPTPSTREAYDWTLRMGAQVCKRSVELGMWQRPLGDVVVFMPPLASTEQDLAAMVAIMHQAIVDVTGDA